MPIVSIIVPCYNQEKYLDACLASIMSQSFAEWECILIDDGSTDESWKIIEKWAANDNRFISHKQSNLGVSAARNKGIEISNSEFLYFLDSDDFFYDGESLGTMVGSITPTVDVISANFCFVHKNGVTTLPNSQEIIIEKNILEDDEILRAFILQKISGIGCNKLFRKSLLLDNKITFDTALKYNEDRLLLLECFCTARRVINLPKITYCYNRANTEAATANPIPEENPIWIDAQLQFLQKIAESFAKYPRWSLIPEKEKLRYFEIQYKFLKTSYLLKRKREWLTYYNYVRSIYQESILANFQERFRYPALISHFAMSYIVQKGLSAFLSKILVKFINF